MRGKSKCKILKQIRQRIANENDIPFVTRECTFQGECRGTCPRCEEELRYLEEQLRRRQSLGKAVTVTALALTLTAAVGCEPKPAESTVTTTAEETTSQEIPMGTLETEPLAGDPTEDLSELGGVPTEECSVELIGEVAVTEITDTLEGEVIVTEPILTGDFAVVFDPGTGNVSIPIDSPPPEIVLPVEPTEPPVNE